MINENTPYNTLDGEVAWSGSLCLFCKFFHGKDKASCDAFPQGIPRKFTHWFTGHPEHHTTIEDNQVGDYLFTKNF